MAQTTDLEHADPELRLVAAVRDKVGAPHVIFDDDSYKSDLGLVGGNVLRAAALRLTAIANSEAYIQKVTKTLELETDGAKLADSYRATARLLLGLAEAALPVLEHVVPIGISRFSRRVDGFSRSRFHDENS